MRAGCAADFTVASTGGRLQGVEGAEFAGEVVVQGRGVRTEGFGDQIRSAGGGGDVCQFLMLGKGFGDPVQLPRATEAHSSARVVTPSPRSLTSMSK